MAKWREKGKNGAGILLLSLAQPISCHPSPFCTSESNSHLVLVKTSTVMGV
ncbi:hypothetical protein E4U55_005194 [Claviceps digitariae]|nr:hypothetical protein E4U55_005194 [Claviceps digitariae]